MTITLSIPDELDRCRSCGAKPIEGKKFCDLVLLDIGLSSKIEFPLCHDCALELVEALLGRYYALWGLVLAHDMPEGQPTILSTILQEVLAIRQHLEGEDTPGQELPPTVEDALASLGKGHA